MDDNTDLIDHLKSGNRVYMEKLYNQWRSEFKSWSEGRYGLNDEESSALYQDTFIQLYMNVKKKKTSEISHPKTYLYGIAKNLLRQRFKNSKANEISIMEVEEEIEIINVHTESNSARPELLNVLKIFGEPCRSILLMFYFEDFSHEVIAARMGYKNEAVVKKKKSQCMSSLRANWKSYLKKQIQ